ncbi:MAG: UbiA family prenyltransferase [Stackebrandtia sp.]
MTQAIHRPATANWRAYVRLAKLDVFDYYLSALLVWSMLAPAARIDPQVLLTIVLFGIGEVFLIAALVAFDDITGFRDGSDAINYGPDAPARRLARKPLLTKAITESAAIRFAWLCAAAATVAWIGAVLVAPHDPLWVILGVGVTLVVGLQYSWGLKLSYHGFQELFIAALGWGLVLPLYGLLAGAPSGFVVTQALLFGLGPLLFGVYSNTNDIDGDRSIGRPTVASLVSPRGNRLFIGAVSGVEIGLIVVPPLTGIAPWWFPLLLLPVIALRTVQFFVGMIRGDIMRARKLGFRIHRICLVLLVVGNLLAGGAG